MAKKLIQATCNLLEEQRKPTLDMASNLIKIELAYINTNHPDFWKAVPALTSMAQGFDSTGRNNPANNLIGKKTLSFSSSGSLENIEDEVSLNPINSTPTSPKSNNNNSPNTGLFSYLFRSHVLSSNQPSNNIPPIPPPFSSPNIAKQKKNNNEIVALSEKEEFETQLIMTLIHSYFSIVRKNLMDSIPKSIMHFLVNATLEVLPSRLVGELYKEELFGDLLKEDEEIKDTRQRIRKELDAHRQALSLLSPLLND